MVDEKVMFPFVVETPDGDEIAVERGVGIWLHTTEAETRPTPNQARALARALMQAADAAEGLDE